MARIARVVSPGLPHHITQRGNRRQQTFFSNEDYRATKSQAESQKHKLVWSPQKSLGEAELFIPEEWEDLS